MLMHHNFPLTLPPTMMATTSLRTVALANNRRWYHCKCVRVRVVALAIIEIKPEQVLVEWYSCGSDLRICRFVIIKTVGYTL